jgi:hypothetical protein
MHSLLKNKKDAYPYDRLVKLREVQDPLLGRAQKKSCHFALPIVGTVSQPKHVDAWIQTLESGRTGGIGYDEEEEEADGFVGDYMVPEDEEIILFGESHIATIGCHYLSQYARGDRSIDKMYGIRRETDGTFMIGYSPLTVDGSSNVTVRDVIYTEIEM